MMGEVKKEEPKSTVGKPMDIGYRDEFDFCKRVVRAVMAITNKKKALDGKEIEIVGVMCKLCINGKQPDLKLIGSEMKVCGVSDIGYQTLRNYMSSIKTKGWIVGKKLNPIMVKAIEDGGFRVGIWLKRDGEGK